MRFLIDTQLPKVLVRHLRSAGYDAEHVLELKLAQSPDNEIWAYATKRGSVILTKDEDFAQWVLAGRLGPAVVWLRIGNCTNPELIAWFLPVLPQISEALNQGDRLVEIC